MVKICFSFTNELILYFKGTASALEFTEAKASAVECYYAWSGGEAKGINNYDNPQVWDTVEFSYHQNLQWCTCKIIWSVCGRVNFVDYVSNNMSQGVLVILFPIMYKAIHWSVRWFDLLYIFNNMKCGRMTKAQFCQPLTLGVDKHIQGIWGEMKTTGGIIYEHVKLIHNSLLNHHMVFEHVA